MNNQNFFTRQLKKIAKDKAALEKIARLMWLPPFGCAEWLGKMDSTPVLLWGNAQAFGMRVRYVLWLAYWGSVWGVTDLPEGTGIASTCGRPQCPDPRHLFLCAKYGESRSNETVRHFNLWDSCVFAGVKVRKIESRRCVKPKVIRNEFFGEDTYRRARLLHKNHEIGSVPEYFSIVLGKSVEYCRKILTTKTNASSYKGQLTAEETRDKMAMTIGMKMWEFYRKREDDPTYDIVILTFPREIRMIIEAGLETMDRMGKFMEEKTKTNPIHTPARD